jgi:hypothetical protein
MTVSLIRRWFAAGIIAFAAIYLCVMLSVQSIAQQAPGPYSFLNPSIINHLLTIMAAPGAPPTVTNGTLTAASTDFFGQVNCTSSANTACVVTFSTPFNVTPFCLATDNSTYEGVRAIASKTSLSITGNAANDNISYACVGTAAN